LYCPLATMHRLCSRCAALKVSSSATAAYVSSAGAERSGHSSAQLYIRQLRSGLLRSGKWYLGAAHGTAGILQSLLLFLETCSSGNRSQEAGAFILRPGNLGSNLCYLCGLASMWCCRCSGNVMSNGPWFN
jgi:hypothetical protein